MQISVFSGPREKIRLTYKIDGLIREIIVADNGIIVEGW